MNLIAHNIAKFQLFSFESVILILVLFMGLWGGLVSLLMKLKHSKTRFWALPSLTHVIMSIFTGFILSLIAVEKSMSVNMIVLIEGLGGMFSGPILRIISDKVAKFLPGVKVFN